MTFRAERQGCDW